MRHFPRQITSFFAIFLPFMILNGPVNVVNVIGSDPTGSSGATSPSKVVCLEDLEVNAQRTMDPSLFNYTQEGSWREVSAVLNKLYMRAVPIWPRVLRNVSTVEMTTKVLGRETPLPFGIAPTGFHSAYHPDGELATARACEELGNIYIVSHSATRRLEEIAAAGPAKCRLWLAIPPRSRMADLLPLIQLAESNRFEALVVTLDGSWSAPRHRTLRSGYSIGSSHPVRISDNPPPQLDSGRREGDVNVTWDWIKKLIEKTKLKIIVKGILHPYDAMQAVKVGVAGVYVSNGGGRNLDTVPPSIMALPAIYGVMNDYPQIDLYFDGGIRSGVDLLKPFALGVNAVFVGRPVNYGLFYNGTGGVTQVFRTLEKEVVSALRYSGCSNLNKIPLELLTKYTLA